MSFTTVVGASASDATTLTGTSGNDSVDILNETSKTIADALAGDDTIRYGQSSFVSTGHTFKGGAGKDVISGIDTSSALASSFINYNAGNDQGSLYDVDASTIKGGKGIDTINIASLESSIFNGNLGNDVLEVRYSASSSIHGGKGEDTLNIFGSHESSSIRGDNEADTISLAAGSSFTNDTINGNAGNDSISVGAIATFSGTSIARGGNGNDTINGATSTVGLNINGDAGADLITGSTAADTLSGGIDTDSFTAGAGADTITGGTGVDNFVFGRALTLTTDLDNITDGEATDNYQINSSTGAALAGSFATLHKGDGAALGATADGATTAADVSTAINVDGTDVDVSSATDTVLIFTTGVANGIDGLIAAMAGGNATTLKEKGGTSFADGDQMVAVVENTTTNQIDVGVAQWAAGDVFDAVFTIYQIDITNGLTAAAVAAQVDFTGLA